MIRLLVVDDERSTREGLIKHIPWYELGVDVVEGAKNGIEALEKAERLHPDILLTDVRMPKMDGIELATIVREKYPECKIIFLSGYSDKEYLKSAIKLNALSYIEKPLDDNEVISTIANAVAMYKSEQDKKKKEEDLENKIKRNAHLIKQKLSADLVKTRVSKSELVASLKDSGISVYENSFFTTITVKINWRSSLSNDSKEASKSAISNMAISILSNISKWFLSGFFEGDLYIIHINEKVQAVQVWDNKLDLLINELINASNQDYTVTIGVGLPVNSIENIQDSFNSAVKAVEMQFYVGVGQVIYFSNLNITNYKRTIEDESLIAAYCELLNCNRRQDLITLLNKFIEDETNSRNMDPNCVRDIYVKLLYNLHSIAKKRGIDILESDDTNTFFWKAISGFSTLKEIHGYLMTQANKFYDCIEEKDSYGRSVYDIIKYIQSNYSDSDLSVNCIAKQMNFSISYLCTFFKKNTGKTINDYITEIRIEKAKELLRDKDVKIYKISKMVGYDNENYFAKIFKKIEKCSPSDFRERYFV